MQKLVPQSRRKPRFVILESGKVMPRFSFGGRIKGSDSLILYFFLLDQRVIDYFGMDRVVNTFLTSRLLLETVFACETLPMRRARETISVRWLYEAFSGTYLKLSHTDPVDPCISAEIR